jgi:flagellar basal body-associated protein FliL
MPSRKTKSLLKTLLLVLVVVFVFAGLVLRLMLFAGRVHIQR